MRALAMRGAADRGELGPGDFHRCTCAARRLAHVSRNELQRLHPNL